MLSVAPRLPLLPVVAAACVVALAVALTCGHGSAPAAEEPHFAVSLARFDAVLAHPREAAGDSRAVPAVEGGRVVGLKLFSIRPGSTLDELGLNNGDVVLRINGHELTSAEKTLELYTSLPDASSIVVDIERRGAPLALHYDIVP